LLKQIELLKLILETSMLWKRRVMMKDYQFYWTILLERYWHQCSWSLILVAPPWVILRCHEHYNLVLTFLFIVS